MQIKLVAPTLYLVLLHQLAVEAVVGIPVLRVQLVALEVAELLPQLLAELLVLLDKVMLVKLVLQIKAVVAAVQLKLEVQMAQVKVAMV